MQTIGNKKETVVFKKIAKEIANREGGKAQVNIAQISEIMTAIGSLFLDLYDDKDNFNKLVNFFVVVGINKQMKTLKSSPLAKKHKKKCPAK